MPSLMEHKTDVATGTPVTLNNPCVPMQPYCTLQRKHETRMSLIYYKNDISFQNLKHILKWGFYGLKHFKGLIEF